LAEATPEEHKALYIVISIDDRNRFIALHEIRANKCTDSVAQALTHVLSHHPASCLLGNGNMGEFVPEPSRDLLW
jgi:hypothetical protein